MPVSWVRERTPTFAYTLVRVFSTVFGVEVERGRDLAAEQVAEAMARVPVIAG